MNSGQYLGILGSLKLSKLGREVIIAVLVAIVFIQASHLRAMVGDDRSHFLPPEINKPFWISGEDASPEYFEALAQFVGLLPLNVTPETAETACKQYLIYILPKDRDKYRTECDVQIARIKRDNVSQMFSVREVLTDAKRRKVALLGTTATYVNGKEFKAQEAYRIEFVPYGGRFYVTAQERVDADDPLNSKKVEK